MAQLICMETPNSVDKVADPYWGMSREEADELKLRSDTGDPEAAARYSCCLLYGYGVVSPNQYARHKLLERISSWATQNWKKSVWAAYCAGECWEAGWGEGIQKDWYRSVDAFLLGVAKNHIPSMLSLAMMYKCWTSPDPHIQKAMDFYNRAAKMGDLEARYQLGQCAENGFGMKQNTKKAFRIYERLAPFHHVAHLALAHCYREGIGVTKDERRAFMLYRAGARRGCISSKYFYVPFCFVHGYGTEHDPDKGRPLLERGVRRQQVGSMILLAKCILGDVFDNPLPLEKACSLLKAAANLGAMHAIFLLATCYETGKGMERPDLELAARYYTEAMLLGDGESPKKLAEFYRDGKGVEKNESRSKLLASLCETQSDIELLYQLGLSFDTSGACTSSPPPTKAVVGTPDTLLAHESFRHAALHGGHLYPKYITMMGIAYANGVHVQQDSHRATKFYLEAGSKGDLTALFLLCRNHCHHCDSSKLKFRNSTLHLSVCPTGDPSPHKSKRARLS